MPKVINIVETKTMQREGVDVERIIFSDDKIVYVRLDNGEVYPENTPDRYVDLISYYKTANNNSHRTKNRANRINKRRKDSVEHTIDENSSDESVNYIKDGTGNRLAQIKKIKHANDLCKMSKNPRIQIIIDSMSSFGKWLYIVGILQVFTGISLFVASAMYGGVPFIIYGVFLMIPGMFHLIAGKKQRMLRYSPTGIRTVAIITIFTSMLSLSILGLIIFIQAISVLVSLGHYEDWYYGEIE